MSVAASNSVVRPKRKQKFLAPPGVAGCAGLLFDQFECPAGQLLVVEEQQVGVEYLGLGFTGRGCDAIPRRVYVGSGGFHGREQPFSLRFAAAGCGVSCVPFQFEGHHGGLGSDPDAW